MKIILSAVALMMGTGPGAQTTAPANQYAGHAASSAAVSPSPAPHPVPHTGGTRWVG